MTERLSWNSICPLSSLRRPCWSRPALLHPWFPCPALRGLQILQWPLLKGALPPVPASSTAVIWQPLRLPLAPYLYSVRPIGLPSSSIAGLEYPSPPPPASEARTLPRPVDPAARPQLLSPSPPTSPVYPSAPQIVSNQKLIYYTLEKGIIQKA